MAKRKSKLPPVIKVPSFPDQLADALMDEASVNARLLVAIKVLWRIEKLLKRIADNTQADG